MRSIFLALPSYGGGESENTLAVADAIFTARKGAGRVITCTKSLSLLALTFNTLWCEALNRREELGLTHFVMLHADVAPESGWLWKILDEMDRVEADILSAVVPIKDDQGITSTALYTRGERDTYRLSLDDLATLPATFDGSRWPEKRLLVNTGLMAVDFRKPWVEKVWFEIRDGIDRLPDGRFVPLVMPEDWNLSLMAEDLGCRVFATQKLSLTHWGKRGWTMPGKTDEPPPPIAGAEPAHAQLEPALLAN